MTEPDKMTSDEWESLLFSDARRAELAAIEEREFQIRLRARNERKRLIVSGSSTNSAALPEAQQVFNTAGDNNGLEANEFLNEDLAGAHRTASNPSDQAVELQRRRKTEQVGSNGNKNTHNGVPTVVPNIQASKKTQLPPVMITAAGPSKRSNLVSVFDDDRRRPSLAKQPRSEALGSAASSPITLEDTDSTELTANATTSDERPPKWYRDLKRDKTRNRGDSNVDILLATLREWIRKAQKPSESKAGVFNEVRGRIHKVAFLPATAKLLKNNWMLDDQAGLPLIFDDRYSAGVAWPWDIKADAEELYIKWCRGIFEVDLMRGIISQKFGNNKRGSERLDPAYKGKVSANYHGNGDLLNGQWWPTRLAMLRDGAHGETQAGISGAEGKGAFACVMSGGLDHERKEYPDEDHGDSVLYCGTDNTSDEAKVTAATQRMIESIGREPVRLIRSSEVRSRFAPEIGYRYDGLYLVVSMERLDPEGSTRQRHRFRMSRVPSQDPLRGGKGPEKRPTAEEIEAYQKMQRGLRGDSSI